MIIKHCPVCSQAGLPDYTKKHTICQQCNSDLKPYMLIRSLQKKSRDKSIAPLIAIIASLCIVLFIFVFRGNNKNSIHTTVGEAKLKLLIDSINVLNRALLVSNKETNAEKQATSTVYAIYTVKKGDNAWRIAEIFYNNGSMFKNIETANKLTTPYSLKIGQKLTIILNQE